MATQVVVNCALRYTGHARKISQRSLLMSQLSADKNRKLIAFAHALFIAQCLWSLAERYI